MPLDPQLGRSIAAHLSYLRDLGIFDIYRRSGVALSEDRRRSHRYPCTTGAAHSATQSISIAALRWDCFP